MSIPVSFSELSTTAASNPPADSEGVSQGDDQFRQVYAFIRSLYEGSTNGQIAFPATQNASANANTLDDYEEGTWTPTDASGAGLSLTVTGASYIKIGKLVYVSVQLTYPSTVSSANAILGGLPFTSATGINYGLAIGYTATTNLKGALVPSNSTQIRLYDITSPYATNAMLSTKELVLSGSYIASA